MKQTVHPGRELNFLSPEEFALCMQDNTTALIRALGRNEMFKRALLTGQANSSGQWTITGGPDTGFIWDVRWVQWSGGGLTNANMNMYIGDPSNVNLIGNNFAAGTGFQQFSSGVVVLYGPDYFTFTQGNINSAANQPIQVQLGIVEVPFAHEAQVI